MSVIKRSHLIPGVVAVLLALAATLLLAQDVGERVVRHGEIDDDIYLAGGEVELDAAVDGDVTAAGGELILDGSIQGDVTAVGGSLTLRGEVADDARLAGGELQVFAVIDDDLIAAAGRILLQPDARVGGRAWLSGGDIRIQGAVAQELRASGARIRITGTVEGDVHLLAQDIEIGPSAVISGDLTTKGPNEARIAEGARIDGVVRHSQAEALLAPSVTGLAGVALVFLLSMVMAGVVLFLIFPRLVERTSMAMREQPWAFLGIGLAVFAATPIVIIILLITVLGLWLGLVLLLVYLTLLMLGYLMGAFFVGEYGLQLVKKEGSGKAAHAIAYAVAIVVLAIIGLVPLLGGLIGWLVMLLGIGALTHRFYQLRTAEI